MILEDEVRRGFFRGVLEGDRKSPEGLMGKSSENEGTYGKSLKKIKGYSWETQQIWRILHCHD